MSQDKTTVSVSSRGQQILDDLVHDKSLFSTELGAFLAAASFALANGIEAVTDLGPSNGTKWNRGSGAIPQWLSLAEWYLPTTEPVKALEAHAEAGLRVLAERASVESDLNSLFAPVTDESATPVGHNSLATAD